jgi:hypothetical protein
MRISIDISKAATKRLLVLGVTFFVGATALIVNAVPVTFSDGNVLTAAQLNQNFADVENKTPTVTAWQAYTPLIKRSDGSTAAGFHTTTGVYRRVGESIEVKITTKFTGTDTGGFYSWELPPTLSFDKNKLPGATAAAGTAELFFTGSVTVCTATIFVPSAGTSTGANLSCHGAGGYFRGDQIPAAASELNIEFSGPITGWAVH